MSDLADRMKMYEDVESKRRFMPFLPVIARLDGKNFSRWTKGLARPFDDRLSQLFINSTERLIEETNACIGYTQSDEVSLIFYSDKIKSQIFFDGRIQKMTSILASILTAKFSRAALRMPEKDHHPGFALFDCRVWQVPTLEEAANYLLSREQDATRNSISMAARCYYSSNQLHGKKGPEMIDMLLAESINWNDYPFYFKRGAYIQKYKIKRKYNIAELAVLPEHHEAKKNPDLEFVRSEIRILDIPPFSKIINKVGVIFNGEEPKIEQEDSDTKQ